MTGTVTATSEEEKGNNELRVAVNGCTRDTATLGARTRGMCDIWGRLLDTGVGKKQDTALKGGTDQSKKMEQTKKEWVGLG